MTETTIAVLGLGEAGAAFARISWPPARSCGATTRPSPHRTASSTAPTRPTPSAAPSWS